MWPYRGSPNLIIITWALLISLGPYSDYPYTADHTIITALEDIWRTPLARMTMRAVRPQTSRCKLVLRPRCCIVLRGTDDLVFLYFYFCVSTFIIINSLICKI